MGCPVGSVLLGSEEDIWYARNLRKMLGGGMRQAGMTAACALVAMEDWESVLKNDNKNAKMLSAELASSVDGVTCDISNVHTNMFVFKLD